MNTMSMLGQIFLWEFKAAPDTSEVFAKGVKDMCLPGSIRAETLELIWAGC